MKLEELKVFNLSIDLGERIWQVVQQWDYFSKETIGKQIVRSADSIAANISEGYGRFHYKENVNFSYYSRGSLSETRTWLLKAHKRNLLKVSDFEEISIIIDDLTVRLNNYIKSPGKHPMST
ncbi:MAG TPA: four helix bundle protein [Bacteroidales bacterium]|nr:four helix bundle protein [Bacteroidales bacterium]